MDPIRWIPVSYDFSDDAFADLFARFDRLHDVASGGQLTGATPLRPSEVIGWLEDIIFTAEETIREIDAHSGLVQTFAGDQFDSIDQPPQA